MRLAMLFKSGALSKESSNITAGTKQVSQSGESFDSYMAQVDKKTPEALPRPVEKRKPAETKKEDTRTKPLSRDKAAEKEPAEKIENSNKGTSTRTTQTSGRQSTDATVSKEDDGLQEKIITKLSEMLDISPEVIAQLLSSLGMQATDLYDRANLNQFIQALYQVDSQAELLSVPNIQHVFEQAGEALAAAGNMETVVDTSQNTAKDANLRVPVAQRFVAQTNTAAIDEENGTILDEILQGPQASNVSAEKVVTGQQKGGGTSGQQTGGGLLDKNDQQIMTPHDEFDATGIGYVANNNVVFQETVVRAESMRNINTPDVVNQIVENLKVEVKGNTTEVKMVLHPESLGEVSLKIATQNGIITAQFYAENQRIKEIIEANFDQLKDVLQQQGIGVAGLSVSVGDGSADEARARYNQEQQRGSGRIRRVMDVDGVELPELREEARYVTQTDVLNNQVEYMA